MSRDGVQRVGGGEEGPGPLHDDGHDHILPENTAEEREDKEGGSALDRDGLY